MKHVLILGATGKLGKVLVQYCLEKNYSVVALVRNAKKLNIIDKNLKVIEGDVTNADDLSHALQNIDVVISTLGHGFRTSFPIQEKTLQALIPLMEKQGVKRFITITGSGLLVSGDPYSFLAMAAEKALSLIDPYRLSDAKTQQKLLEKSHVDWTVVRTPIHNGSHSDKISYAGFAQPPFWKTISRHAICTFIVDCTEKDQWVRKSPIIF